MAERSSTVSVVDPPGSGSEEAGPSQPAGTERLTAHLWEAGAQRVVGSLTQVRAAMDEPGARTWVDVQDASEATLTELAAIFDIHHLVAEDIVERNQRAKIVSWDENLHLVLFVIEFDGALQVSEVDIVLGQRFLITSHPPRWQPEEALGSNGRDMGSYLGQGTDMLLYALIDPIVDGYFPVIDRISDEIDELEDVVIAGTDMSVVERLFRVRRSLLEIRHLVGPEREILNQLSNRDMPLIDPAHRPYFRDVYDHTIRVTDELDTHRELANGVLDAYLSSVNNSLSDVMKRLTAITAVLAGVGAAAGLFGMSEAGSSLGLPLPLGFWLVAGVVVAIGIVVFVYFHHIDWI